MKLALRSLRQQLVAALVIFLLAITTVITAFTVISNERAERFTWTTMLGFEMDRIEHLVDDDDAGTITTTDDGKNKILYFSEKSNATIPAPFAALGKGVHDDIKVDGRLFAAMVRGEDDDRRVLAVDVTSVEEKERELAKQVLITMASLMVLFGLIAFWGLNRFLKPLRQLSDEIALLKPENATQSVPPIPRATSEITTISDAINAYVERNRQFLEREREFINTASHELRTPIAILRNNLQLSQTDLRNSTDPLPRLERSSQVVDEMADLLSVLLVLARDPSKLAPLYEEFDLRDLLNEVTAQHSHLLELKELSFEVAGAGVIVNAPPKLAHVALSNLIRNAIENSDRGVIRAVIAAPGTVTITDPDHGMTPKEISALYAKAARGGGGDRQLGIGLQLLSRICSHLGWSLNFAESDDGHTQATLNFPSAEKLS